MHFFSGLLVGASALVSIVAAQSNTLFFTSVPSSVEAGRQYNISFTAPSPSAPVTITLREGRSDDLNTVATLTSDATGGTYLWTPSEDLPNSGAYALQITQGSEINYSGQFALSGGSATPASSSRSASASASASGSSGSSASLSTAAPTTVITTGASAATSLTVSGNSTITTPTLSGSSGTSRPTGASASGASATTSIATAPTGAANNVKSPMALVLGAVAAMAYLG